MALIACKDCGEKVSSTAGACPKCGRPQPYCVQSLNRRGFWIVALFVIGVFLSSSQDTATSAFLEENTRIGGPRHANPHTASTDMLYPFVLLGNAMITASLGWGVYAVVAMVRSRR